MISYLLEVNICWALLYLLYWLTFSKETFFTLNRLYLLGALITGLLLPFVSFNSTLPLEHSEFVVFYLNPITIGVKNIETNLLVSNSPTDFNSLFIIKLIYWVGVLFGTCRLIWGLIQLIQLGRKGNRIQRQGYILLQTTALHLPFSFFNLLFWSKQFNPTEEEAEKIIIHERAHIQGWHSLDIIFLEILGIVMWWSPFVYLYRKSIRNLHEYLADKKVLQSTHLKKYGQLLIKQSQSGLQIAFANHFFQSQLKKTIFYDEEIQIQQHCFA